MFELTFLGTSASAPSVHRGLSAHLVQHDEYRFLLDCGEGTQRQILRAGVGFKRLNRILITHGHLDHILGLGGLLSTLMRWETLDYLEIYAGPWALARVKTLLFDVVLGGHRPPVEVALIPVKPGVVFEADDFTITAFPVRHRSPDCYGYAFEEKGRRHFLPEKAEALGVPPGPERRALVQGQAITLPDGRVVRPDDVLGPLHRGARYIHTGDVGHTGELVTICRDADVLVTEATYLEEEADMARRFAHLTAKQAAALAAEAGVKQLVLTHLSRRYREQDVLREAREIFPNTVVARDFDRFQIRRGEVVMERPPKRRMGRG